MEAPEVSTYEAQRLLSDPDFDDNLGRTLESLGVTRGKFLTIQDEDGLYQPISLGISILPYVQVFNRSINHDSNAYSELNIPLTHPQWCFPLQCPRPISAQRSLRRQNRTIRPPSASAQLRMTMTSRGYASSISLMTHGLLSITCRAMSSASTSLESAAV